VYKPDIAPPRSVPTVEYEQGAELQRKALGGISSPEQVAEVVRSEEETRKERLYARPPFVTNAIPTPAQQQALDITQDYTVVSRWLGRKLGMLVGKDAGKHYVDELFMKVQDGELGMAQLMDKLRAEGLNLKDAWDIYRQQAVSKGQVGAELQRGIEEFFNPAVEALQAVQVTDAQIDQLAQVSQGFDTLRRKNQEASYGWLAPVKRAWRTAMGYRKTDLLALGDIYLIARHAQERNADLFRRSQKLPTGPIQDGSGMSNAEAQAILDFVNQRPDLKMGLENYAAMVRRMINHTEQIKIESGLKAGPHRHGPH